MFGKDQLLQQLSELIDKPVPRISALEFLPDDFPSHSSEETIRIYRSSKSDFESAQHFWVAAEQQNDWTGRENYLKSYLELAVCQPMIESDFMELLNQIPHIKPQMQVVPNGHYLWGQKMLDDWNIQSAIAEFEFEYISFYWDTTA